MFTVLCVGCGTAFKQRHKHQMYCSRACYKATCNGNGVANRGNEGGFPPQKVAD